MLDFCWLVTHAACEPAWFPTCNTLGSAGKTVQDSQCMSGALFVAVFAD